MKACMSQVLRKILDDPRLATQLKSLLAQEDRDSMELLLQYDENTIYKIEMVGIHSQETEKAPSGLFVRFIAFLRSLFCRG